jgi:outer membrane receptor protein involved in Fe transport
LSPPGAESIPGSDNFWVVDASINYRLPKRFGLLTVGVKNLFDENFMYQDTDPTSPQILPKRLIFARLTLAI